MSMQQQHADYDLLAVFNDETIAEAAAAKLRKEGFGDEEVFQVAPGSVGTGQFREHGPNRSRGDVFLQTTRSGPSPLLILFLAIALGIVFGGVTFAVILILIALHLLFFALAAEPVVILGGGVLGVIVGAIVGATRRGRVRGAIGQDVSKSNALPVVPSKGTRNAVALRFPDSDNISRKSRARAILIQNGGKIDRSVGRTE